MQLIVGLGNPGQEYFLSRHNVGFEIVDSIYSYFKFPEFKLKFSGLISIKQIFNNNVILFKPYRFMNLSGEPTRKVRNYYKIKKNDQVFVFHDDLDMDFSKIRIKVNGGHGGHNGIRDIIKFLGPNFIRLKFGIKNSEYENKNIPANKFVLDKFNEEEISRLNQIKNEVNKNLNILIQKNHSLFLNSIRRN
tara:strand:- start:93 stop:665 length:573 start_codon:yes stop_codon:yes gene_type:complete